MRSLKIAFHLLWTSIWPSSKANHDKNCHCLKFCRLRVSDKLRWQATVEKPSEAQGHSTDTLGFGVRENWSKKLILCAILLDALGRPKIMIAVAVCEKVTYKRGRQSREKKLEFFWKMAQSATFEIHVLDFSAPVTPQWRLLLKTRAVHCQEKHHHRTGASHGLKQRNLKFWLLRKFQGTQMRVSTFKAQITLLQHRAGGPSALITEKSCGPLNLREAATGGPPSPNSGVGAEL